MTDRNTMGKSQTENLINDEVKRGELDEKSIESQAKKKYVPFYTKKFVLNDKKKMNSRKNEICRQKLHTHDALHVVGAIQVPVCQKPNELSKQNYNVGRCVTKEEWMTLTPTLNRKCLPHFKSMEDKNSRVIPKRINDLAQPPRQRIVSTLKDRGKILPTPLVDRLINILDRDSSSPSEQVEKLSQAKKTKKRKKKRNRQEKPSQAAVGATARRKFDEDTIVCQYSMAEAFLRTVLESECKIPRDDFQDISHVIFNRMKQLFHVDSVDNDARRTQQMRLLADVIAGWIAGVLFEIAELEDNESYKSDTAHNVSEEDSDNDDDGGVIDMENFGDTASLDLDDDNYSKDNNEDEHEDELDGKD